LHLTASKVWNDSARTASADMTPLFFSLRFPHSSLTSQFVPVCGDP